MEQKPNHKKLWAYVGGLLVLGGVLVFILLLQPAQNKLKVSFLDVGQGDSILIQTPSGGTMLIDGGRDNAVLSRLGTELPFFKRNIDVVIATHPDADHVTGLVNVLEKYKVGSVLEPGVTVNTDVYQNLQQIILNKNIPHIYARAGQKIMLDQKNNIYLTILYPDTDVTGWETNDASIVARLDYGNTSFMFTGDSPIGKELYLVQHNPAMLPVDVLKLGHHGSRTSSSVEYLMAVHPKLAIISAGFKNQYGHPHKEVLDRLKNLHIPYLETSKIGTINCVSNGQIITCK